MTTWGVKYHRYSSAATLNNGVKAAESELRVAQRTDFPLSGIICSTLVAQSAKCFDPNFSALSDIAPVFFIVLESFSLCDPFSLMPILS